MKLIEMIYDNTMRILIALLTIYMYSCGVFFGVVTSLYVLVSWINTRKFLREMEVEHP